MNTVTINNKQLPVVEFRSFRVVTFAMIDEVRDRKPDTAAGNFRKNRHRFIEGEDFFELGSGEIYRNLPEGTFSKYAANGIVLTESGYLMLVKSLTDDLAWRVQRELVNSYFRHQKPKTQNEIIAAMALANVEQERRLAHIESKVGEVAEMVGNIARGAVPPGWTGYAELKAQCGLSDAKCRQLVSAYNIAHKPVPFIAPGGTKSTMTIVCEQPFMDAFRKMMAGAEQRGKKWCHPQMGLFQVIGRED